MIPPVPAPPGAVPLGEAINVVDGYNISEQLHHYKQFVILYDNFLMSSSDNSSKNRTIGFHLIMTGSNVIFVLYGENFLSYAGKCGDFQKNRSALRIVWVNNGRCYFGCGMGMQISCLL
jgi:hypothetical protein